MDNRVLDKDGFTNEPTCPVCEKQCVDKRALRIHGTLTGHIPEEAWIHGYCEVCGNPLTRKNQHKYCSPEGYHISRRGKSPCSTKGLKLGPLPEKTKLKIGKSLRKKWDEARREGTSWYSHEKHPTEEFKKRQRERGIQRWENEEERTRLLKVRREAQRIHNKAINEEIKNLLEQGFRCIPLHQKPHPDIIAIKEDKVYAVEVEFSPPDYNKYEGTNYYDDIIWIRRRRK